MTASHAPPIVFADVNVLYASAPRDILIELALADVIELRWSQIVNLLMELHSRGTSV